MIAIRPLHDGATRGLLHMLATACSVALIGAAGPALAGAIKMERIKVFPTGIFDGSAAEIVSFDPITERLFVTDSAQGTLDIFDLNGGTAPINSIALDGGGPNSVSVKNGLVAVAVEGAVKTDPGTVQFYDANGNLQKTVGVGALPDMVTFTPDGSKLLVANEGEPNGVDPEGSVSIIDLSAGVAAASVSTAGFTAFNGSEAALKAKGVRLFAGKSVSEDVEPEYITVAPDNLTAFVSLQEANSLGVLDLATNSFTDIVPLGFKDHRLPANALDPSDRDSGIQIANHPVFGLYMSDAIASFVKGGQSYIVTVNEGDSRGEEERVKNLTLDATAFPDAATLQQDEVLGRLEVSTIDGDTDNDGDYDELFAYGARSFSIFAADGSLVYDSGDDFEQLIAAMLPVEFNSDNTSNDSFDSRSDAKGVEPEALTIAQLDGMMLAFIGLERMGGIMVYDITDPFAPEFLLYQNDRDFSLSDEDLEAGLGLALGPEGMAFVPAADNSLGQALLLVANEASGSTEVYTVQAVPLPASLGFLAGGLGLFGLLCCRRRRD
jgi:2',3'-cyclic-nucleotide 2'-phosphodiesterase / 3'-nucleotidase / 5'-nucleotidase